MNPVLRNDESMSIPWADFFRPDAQSSNRALKKFLGNEGLDLGHRDIVLLRQMAEHQVFLSYAALESWAEAEFERAKLERLLAEIASGASLNDWLSDTDLSVLKLPDGPVLVGVSGELQAEEPASRDTASSQALVRQSMESQSSPLALVFGGEAQAQPSAGVWKEEELHAESVRLLDGESSVELVEAFRHLFRAAPSGGARASVVAAALSRHRRELDIEVSEKLEEIAPPFGQALRQLFEGEVALGARALHFLLKTEGGADPPAWAHFWQQIRPNILESLAKTERGTDILIRCVDQLAQTASGSQFLNHQLLDVFLHRLDELTPSQQDSLVQCVVEWAQGRPDAKELLKSRLDLTGIQNERLLLGECLRRALVQEEDSEGLRELARIFVAEAISAGSTAGSLALAEILRAFGPLVLENTAASEVDLKKLTERQTLNLIAIWELMAAEKAHCLPRVTELYLWALQNPADHLSLLLKSELLQVKSVYQAFQDWLQEGDYSLRRQVVTAGYRWSLSVENRRCVAQALSCVDWDFLQTWEGEWRRPHLSYQRLGWLALCAPNGVLEFETDLQDQISELLKLPPVHLYFWELMRCCAVSGEFGAELRGRLWDSAFQTFRILETHQQEERELLFEVGAATVNHQSGESPLWADWPERFAEGSVEDVWWLSGVLYALYKDGLPAPTPERELVSAIIKRLLTSGEKSMGELLSQALLATDEKEPEPDAHFVPLEVSNLSYEALAAVADHPSCPKALQATIRRRLALFLISWANQLRVTQNPYAFRETPLFAILRGYLEDENDQLQALLSEIAALFLDLHRKVPEKLRLEVRHTAQHFFEAWALQNPDAEEAEGWSRVLKANP